ncbi:MAG TPA: glutamyl-tRNA reductase [Syntrophobacteraceae bacterium]|nr:glutamyl-tRNA reductase [Syntrophobacteraceae bacterium]
MSHIVLLGMNHKTAPVDIREQLAAACLKDINPLHMIPHLEHVEEMVFLSTCNRVEFLFTCNSVAEGMREIKALLKTHVGLPASVALDSYLYLHKDLDAVKHLFMVASSLDSMIVGEPQILGQLKDAYRCAVEYRTVRVILNRLLHKSFSVAKRVRTETCIGSCAVSVSYAAVALARKIFGDLWDKSVLLIGAGEMAELAAENFLAQGVKRMMVANRTLERAMELAARFRAETVPFDRFLEELKTTDIVVCSTGALEPVIVYQDVRSRMRERRNRPLFFIDIAVPRDVDPKVNKIDNVYVYDIDDLQGVIDLNREERLNQAQIAEHIIDEETIKFRDWMNSLSAVPTIVSVRQKAERIRRNEVRKTFSQLPDLSDRQKEAIEILTESIIKKLLHDPIVFLKKRAQRDTQAVYMDFTQQLFNLAESGGGSESRDTQPDLPAPQPVLPTDRGAG